MDRHRRLPPPSRRAERSTGSTVRRERVTPYRRDPADPTSLSSDFRRITFLKIVGAAFWVASGAWTRIIRPRNRHLQSQYEPYPEAEDPRVQAVQDIVEDREGTLLDFHLDGGLLRFDPATGTFTSYRHDPDDPQSIPSDWLTCLRFDQDGMLWIGTNYGGGLLRFDPATERFTSYPDLVPGLVSDPLHS